MADIASVSSKSTRIAVHKLAQKLGFYLDSLKPSLSKRPAAPDAAELATTLNALIERSQIDPQTPHTVRQEGHAVCATVAGAIEPKPNLLPGPSELDRDSGYGSSAPTPASSLVPEGPRSKPTLKPFAKSIPTDVQNRFHDLRLLYGPALLDAVAKTKARNISMKLKYLGESENTAKLYIVVQCDRAIVKKVERFFSQKHVLEDLGSDFLVDVRGGTLLSLAGAAATFDVSGILGSRVTFCGMSIVISNGDAHRRATFGGLIVVTTAAKGTVLYGVTAAHPAADLAPPPMSEADDGDDSDSENGDSEEPSQPLLETSTTVSINPQIELENYALVGEDRRSIGTITEAGLFRTGDLALIELDDVDPLPNRIFSHPRPVEKVKSAWRRRFLIVGTRVLPQRLDLFASARQEHSFQSWPAAVLTSRGLQHGRISSSRSALAASLDAEFVQVFDFCPGQGAGACRDLMSLLGPTLDVLIQKTELLPGDSGSWVVDPLTSEVYGHVVSTDAFGEASVIPIQTSLQEVKKRLHAVEATLPTPSIFRRVRITKKSAKEDDGSAIRAEEQDGREGNMMAKSSKTKRLVKRLIEQAADALSRPDAAKTLPPTEPLESKSGQCQAALHDGHGPPGWGLCHRIVVLQTVSTVCSPSPSTREPIIPSELSCDSGYGSMKVGPDLESPAPCQQNSSTPAELPEPPPYRPRDV